MVSWMVHTTLMCGVNWWMLHVVVVVVDGLNGYSAHFKTLYGSQKCWLSTFLVALVVSRCDEVRGFWCYWTSACAPHDTDVTCPSADVDGEEVAVLLCGSCGERCAIMHGVADRIRWTLGYSHSGQRQAWKRWRLSRKIKKFKRFIWNCKISLGSSTNSWGDQSTIISAWSFILLCLLYSI
jgi:hypothetical protein